MSKELSLSISERVACAKIFDEFKGNITTLAALLDDIKKIAVTPEEWETAKLVKTPKGDGSEQWNWKDEGSEKTLDLSDATTTYLKSTIAKKSDANELGLSDQAVLSLNSKLQ